MPKDKKEPNKATLVTKQDFHVSIWYCSTKIPSFIETKIYLNYNLTKN